MTIETYQSNTTESDALRDILAWSIDRPGWQQDALRRLAVSGVLTEYDIDELTALCKNKMLPIEPLSKSHMSAKQPGAPTVALKCIRGVQNVNALVENQSLNFLPKGVTVIYGDNGAGKSGYVRILKRACRARTARGIDEEILPNIYQQSTGPQRAEIVYEVGEQKLNTEWKNGDATEPRLSEISVFDARTANVHVEETNNLAYTPYPMKLLERLVSTCKAVKVKIDTEISTIKAKTPQSISNPTCMPNTETGKLIGALSKDTQPEVVSRLATFSEKELARFAELTSDLAEDSNAKARQLRAWKSHLEDLRRKLKALESAISPENAKKLEELAADLQAKNATAKLASQDLFKDEPLKGVGSETWQKLWEAARSYSTTEAYVDQPFPVFLEDARCVLCQQELDKNAANRLQRFENFVKDHTQQDAEIAKQSLSNYRSTLVNTVIKRSDLLREWLFISDELGNNDLATSVRAFTLSSLWRLRAILRANADVDFSISVLSRTNLDTFIQALETRALTLLADDDSEERKAFRVELAELKDRQWLAGIKDDFLAEIDRLKAIDSLTTALRDTRHNTITSKNTSLSEKLVTERLRRSFAQEINRLNLDGLAVELIQERSQNGVSRFRISLIQSASHNVGEILSEGEHRCVALAGFLAELATNNSESGIIFDDPVSSLDHLHREAIAKRLAEEGRKRQVIVLTHDLPFLFLLRNACTQVDDPSQQTEVALRHIQKRNSYPGYCRNEPPDKAQNAQSRLNTMRSHLSNTRIQYERDPDSTTWLITARGLIDSLRQTWESAVEDAISPVLRTFSSKVNTKGFAKLSAITEEDAVDMRQRYGRLSELLHKISDELNPRAPSPDMINDEIKLLENWLVSVFDRQNKINAS